MVNGLVPQCLWAAGRTGSRPIATLLTYMDGGNADDCREQPPSPAISADAGMNKRCSDARLLALGYQFQYPSYNLISKMLQPNT